MPRASRYPQAEQLVLDWLTAGLTEPVFTETDTSIDDTAPAFKVQVVGGSSFGIDRTPSVEICALAVGRAEALLLLDKADALMQVLACNGTASGFVDEVRLTFYPSVEPYENSGLHQATATYAIDFRPRQ